VNVTPYSDGYAEFYDLFYGEKAYEAEAAFVADRLVAAGIGTGSRILELACGTGEHALRLAKRGYAVTATDISGAMLDCARAKARAQDLSIEFAEVDMRELVTAKQPFDAAICLFDSIGYARTDSAVGAVLDGVYRSLRAGGVFIVEFWHAPAMLSGFDPVRVRRFKRNGATVLRISETELDREQCLAQVTYNVYELRPDSTYIHVEERHTARYFALPEMLQLAQQHGFEPVSAHDGFRSANPVCDNTWHVVAVLQKPG
jgi:ubiquinone/menaquinone biosynthesis C-methylase UbiE